MNDTGWIRLYRQILVSDIWKKPASWIVCWIYILLKVDYKSGQAIFHNAKREALPKGISNATWHRCLQWLEKNGMIERKKIYQGEIIKVVNYEKFQGFKIQGVKIKVNKERKVRTYGF
jgi:CTP-dependent riboflavin kinase